MKKLYIFGSGGFAKEVYFLVSEINKENNQYDVAGFIDVEPKTNQIKIGSKSIEVIDEKTFFDQPIPKDVCFAIGMGNPSVLNKIKQKYLAHYEFPNLIHPNVKALFDTVLFEKGNIVAAGCIFTVDIKIGSFNIFNLNSTVGHDVVIGDCNVINPGVNISGGVEIGNNNLIGTNATILQYLKIIHNNTIGAGTMVNTDIDSNKVAVGVPVKIIKENN